MLSIGSKSVSILRGQNGMLFVFVFGASNYFKEKYNRIGDSLKDVNVKSNINRKVQFLKWEEFLVRDEKSLYKIEVYAIFNRDKRVKSGLVSFRKFRWGWGIF